MKTVKRLLKRAFLASMAAAIVISAAGCGGSGDTQTASSIDKIKEKGVLTLATASGYPPYEFVSAADNGEVVGIDVALAQKVADKIGVSLKVDDMAFSELITTLQSGNCDIVIAGLPETEERAQAVDFSKVYLNDKQCIIVRAEDADKYSTLNDFSGKKVAVEMGSSSETVARDEIQGADIVSLSLISDVFLELENGSVDAVVTGEVVGKQYMISNSALAQLDIPFTNSDKPASAAVRKGDSELLELVNSIIDEVSADGTMDAWVEEYSQKASENAQ